MRNRLFTYLAVAFRARPKSMFVAPNYIFLGMIGLLSVLYPGVLLLGLGIELLYLYALASHPRFQRLIDGQQDLQARGKWEDRLNRLLLTLDVQSRVRYQQIAERCKLTMSDVALADQPETRLVVGEALSGLAWVYLQMLVARQSSRKLLTHQTAVNSSDLSQVSADLEKRLSDQKIDGDLRRSLEGQLDLVRQRLRSQQEATDRLQVIDAELTRIEQQVHLVREQALLATDQGSVSNRIDSIQSTLAGTSEWIREQQRLNGELAETFNEVPPARIFES